MNKLKIKLDPGAFLPLRAHPTDAGLDLRSPIDIYLPGRGSVVIDTGVHVQIPHGYFGALKSKSGLNVKHGIVSEGVIDEGYSGSIVTKLYNHSDMGYMIKRGDKISQLVIIPCVYPEPEEVDELEGGERGTDGFGSTGR